jgi:hypothetical protein
MFCFPDEVIELKKVLLYTQVFSGSPDKYKIIDVISKFQNELT